MQCNVNFNQQSTQTEVPSTTQQEPKLSAWYGIFYEGMTAEDSKKINKYGGFFERRTFEDIDTDKDGVLSKKEIIEEQKLETQLRQKYKWLTDLMEKIAQLLFPINK